jgi:predicted dehydrogenase
MRAAAVEGGAVLAVGHDFRFFPVAQAAHRLLAQRALGRILRVDARQSAGTRWPCLSPASLTTESGGGVLMSFGVHTLDLLLWWLGELNAVRYRDDAEGGVESECECELLHPAEDTPVHVEISRRRTLRDSTVIACSGGTMEISLFEPTRLRITHSGDAPTIDAQVVDPEFDGAPLKTVFKRQLADFVAAIDTGRAPLVGGEAGSRAVTLIEACYSLRQPLRRSWDFPEAYRSTDAGTAS